MTKQATVRTSHMDELDTWADRSGVTGFVFAGISSQGNDLKINNIQKVSDGQLLSLLGQLCAAQGYLQNELQRRYP